MIDVMKINGKILCDDQGEGVLIMGIKIKEERRQDGELKARLTIGGTAHAHLNNNSDVAEGVKTLDEPYFCEEMVDLESEDKKMFLDKLNRTFQVDPPLVDDGDDVLLRLVEGGDAHAQIVGKKAFFKVNVKAGTENSQYGPSVFTNFFNVPIKVSATKESLKNILAKLQSKKAVKEKEAKDNAKKMEELLG